MKFEGKMKDHQHFKYDFHLAGKSWKNGWKVLRGWSKNEENSENFEIF